MISFVIMSLMLKTFLTNFSYGEFDRIFPLKFLRLDFFVVPGGLKAFIRIVILL